jgi:hypothetical protein
LAREQLHAAWVTAAADAAAAAAAKHQATLRLQGVANAEETTARARLEVEEGMRALDAARQTLDIREQRVVAREAAVAHASQLAQAQAEAASQRRRTARHQQAHSRGGALGDTQSSQRRPSEVW